MVHTHDSILIINQLRQLPHISRVQKITVHEQRPPLEPCEKGRQKSRERELGALGEIARPCVDPLVREVLQLERDDLQRYSGMLQERMPAHFVCELFPGIKSYKDCELLEATSTFGSHMRVDGNMWGFM